MLAQAHFVFFFHRLREGTQARALTRLQQWTIARDILRNSEALNGPKKFTGDVVSVCGCVLEGGGAMLGCPCPGLVAGLFGFRCLSSAPTLAPRKHCKLRLGRRPFLLHAKTRGHEGLSGYYISPVHPGGAQM